MSFSSLTFSLLGWSNCSSVGGSLAFGLCISQRGTHLVMRLSIHSRPLYAMSGRGQRGGTSFRGGGRGGGRNAGGGRGRSGRGEQRWWDPVWRAERLRQKAAEVEVLDESEWWNMMQQMKGGSQQELIIKRNYGRQGQETLANMAQRLGLHFHAYNNGKTLVVSKVPLANYRADLDERHGSNQKEIQMSLETKQRVEKLLSSSKGSVPFCASNGSSVQTEKHSLPAASKISSSFVAEDDANEEKYNVELRDRHKKMMAKCSKVMKHFREQLPAYKVKADFLKAVAENQVMVVSGETGSGKTTQLPQFILDEEISCLRGAKCNIICTQPRRISAISVAARVSSERGEELGETVGYQIRLEAKRSPQTRLLFCTTGVLLRQLVQEPYLTGVSHLIVDEIHERGMNEDFLVIILRDLLPRRPDLRLVLMSATINAHLFSQYFGNAPMLHIPGFTFPVAEMFLEDILEKTSYTITSEFGEFQVNSRRRQSNVKDPLMNVFEEIDIQSHYKSYTARTRTSLEAWDGSKIDLALVEATIEHICCHEKEGAILVFLTGWDEISKLLEKIKGNNLLGNSSKYLILPLHGSMPTVNQREIFDKPTNNMRKIVLATNIAESSITIDDVVYVIDGGKAKETSYDALNKLACLLPSWISKASAHQRRGRAGRVQPGTCYRLYPKIIYDAMSQYQLPEILRTPLQELCLNIKSLRLGTIASFLAKALEPPDPLSVQNAIELLKTIGALDEMEELTSLGRHLSALPLDPNIGKMLLMGCIFQCLDSALTIASALAHRDPFILPINKKEEADAVKKYFADDSCSDHIALLKAFEGWKDAKCNGSEKSFCWKNFLSHKTLQMMEEMRIQFFNLLSDIGFVNKMKGAKAYNHYNDDLEVVCAILCAGLYPNVVQCKRRGKRTALYSKEVGKVDIHPSSVNSGVHIFPLPFLVFGEMVKTSSIYIRDSTNISDYALLLFGGSLVPSKTGGEGIGMLGGYLHFSASKSVLQLIKSLREELDRLLVKKIEEPKFDILAAGEQIVAAAVELLHSQNVRY